MPRLVLLLVALTGCAAPRTEPADPATAALAAIDTTDLKRFTAELGSDAYEGRGTGTRGEEKTVAFVIDRFRELGLVGGMPDGSFRQEVPLRSVRVTEATPLALASESGEFSFAFGPDFFVTTDMVTERVTLDDAEMLFVGYGIDAPGYSWDDYKGVDVAGKVLVSFVNDPPATNAEPDLFQADTLTYTGRWTYKFEEARRRGALGMLLIHTDATAGYPFSVLNGDPYGAHYTSVEPPDGALAVQGWMSGDAASRLAAATGMTLDEWFRLAGSRAFRPMPLSVRASVAFAVEQRTDVTGTNVVAKIPGATTPGEAIVYGAHHDHLGIDEAKEARGEDGIYNGAVDNASGVAMMLELAEAFQRLPEPPARSVYFVTFSAEEAGLLGSAFFAEHPPIPLADMIANVNVDSGNLYGETDDIVGIGAERSELQGLLVDAAAQEGLTVTPDPNPNQGIFFRSDQLAFARGGVPAVFINTGRAFRGRDDGYAARISAEYRQNRYHKPSDELTPDLSFGGILQQTRVAFRLGYALASSELRPQWRPSEAFAETRRQSEAQRGR